MLAEQKRGQPPFVLALEEQTPTAKSSMVASAVFQNPYIEHTISLKKDILSGMQ